MAGQKAADKKTGEIQQHPEPNGISKATLQMWQTLGGLFFGTFLVLHLLTTACATYGPTAFNDAITTFRYYYQDPRIEPVILLSLLIHIVSGGILHWRRDKFGFMPTVVVYPWHIKLRRFSGSVLSVLVPLHFVGGRLESMIGNTDLDDYEHYHVALKMSSYFFVPWFTALVVFATIHLFLGVLDIIEKHRVVKMGTYNKWVHHWLFWLAIISTIFSVLAGLAAIYYVPGDPTRMQYWSKIMEHKIPAILRTN